MLGDAIIFILYLNEHKGQQLVLTERKFQETVPQRHVFKLVKVNLKQKADSPSCGKH
jgi:hypothetical protein